MFEGAHSCGNCDFGRGRHASDDLAARAEAAGHPVAALHCLRNPLPVAKRPEDACGEHSLLARLRDRDLADMIALAVAKQLREDTAMPIRGASQRFYPGG
jgi:hypothetical protein